MNKFNPVSIADKRGDGLRPRHFTVSEANRSLVLVGKIVKDVLGLYCRAKMIEEHYSVLDRETERQERLNLKRQYESLLEQLQAYNRELNTIGCQLRDWKTGTVDWPALYDGREVYLCWRMGDSQVEYWHEAYEDFVTRQRIEGEFKE
ncbi:MAG: DUF2203 domain-containing protein [Phycisphaerae bacterium]